MVKIGTFCKECIFSVDGCRLGLHEKWRKLGNLTETEDGIVIDRICQWRRDEKWPGLLDQSQDPIIAVKEEVHITGTVVIAFNEYDITKIETKLSSLNKMDMIQHFNIVISLPVDSEPKKVFDIAKSILSTVSKIDVNVVIEEFNLENFSAEAFRKAKNGYVIFLDGSQELDTTVLKRLDNAINEDLKQIVFVRPINGFHQTACLSALYKFLYGNKQKTVEEKIDIMANDQNLSRLLVTWGEI